MQRYNKMRWLTILTSALLFQLMVSGRVESAAAVRSISSRMGNDTFLYFAYGSNLLSKRIHIQNPTAERRGIGRLMDYRLDFYHFAPRWNGAPSTIVPDVGREVWGAIWEINMQNLHSLDSQEGVDRNVYRPLEVTVETPSGSTDICRVYILCDNPGPLHSLDQDFTAEPSQTYIHVIISGAIESGLPEEYIQWLKSAKHNGQKAKRELVQALDDHLASLDKTTLPPRSSLLSVSDN